jgi:enterochelin esterase-like enzyme
MYDLENYKLTFEEKIGGESSDYIKMKEVEQNSAGNKYALAYFNDGKFMLRNFGKTTSTEEQIKENELDINALIGIDDWTLAI